MANMLFLSKLQDKRDTTLIHLKYLSDNYRDRLHIPLSVSEQALKRYFLQPICLKKLDFPDTLPK